MHGYEKILGSFYSFCGTEHNLCLKINLCGIGWFIIDQNYWLLQRDIKKQSKKIPPIECWIIYGASWIQFGWTSKILLKCSITCGGWLNLIWKFTKNIKHIIEKRVSILVEFISSAICQRCLGNQIEETWKSGKRKHHENRVWELVYLIRTSESN